MSVGEAGPGRRDGHERGRIGRVVRSPAFAILLIAPFFGESLSGSTPPLDLALPWNLALMVALYGSGALLCREVARRFRLGFVGLILLGAAYAVYEEALVDRYWFDPHFWKDVGVGTYSEVWHTNVLLALHLSAFHTAVSICSSILVVERMFPADRERAWAGRRGLATAAVALGVVLPLVYGEFPRPSYDVLAVAVGLCVLLVVGAFLAPHLAQPSGRRRSRSRGLAWLAFLCTTTHFVLVYAVPSTKLQWPLGVALAITPLVVGVLVIPRMAVGGPYGPDGLRVVTGILSFFILLDILVGLGGRYDLTAWGIAMACALWWLHRRDRADDGLASGRTPATSL